MLNCTEGRQNRELNFGVVNLLNRGISRIHNAAILLENRPSVDHWIEVTLAEHGTYILVDIVIIQLVSYTI